MDQNEKRFYMGWGAAVLMFGVALVGYFLNSDALASAGVFFLGLGIVLVIMAFRSPMNSALVGFGAILVLVGIIISAVVARFNLILMAAAIFIAAGFGLFAYGFTREE